ncbi:MAG: MBL fold metallo-hydrolase [Spirochaetia bacterium]|jgi:phosphoribosyl 1,2-cyclic phosphate phosphodiesterase|nr:MBL fold metallo-hydrolase [Spirochaetia bacterium]
MTVTFLGTGTSHGIPVAGCACPVCLSPDSRNKRTRASLLVEEAGRLILIDTATELRLQAIREGIKTIDAVLYTHAHADHVHGIDDLRIFCYRGPIPVYGSPGILREIKHRFDYIFRPPRQQGGGIPRLRMYPAARPVFTACGVPVTPIPIKHGSLTIYGYRIGDMAYLTDCSHIPDASRPLLENLRVLILGALRSRPHPTHFCIEEALAEIRRIGPRQAYLTHFCHDIDHETIKKELPPGTAPSYDGLKVSL